MGAGPRFEATPSWRLAIILITIVLISYLVEHFLHWLQHRLEGHDAPFLTCCCCRRGRAAAHTVHPAAHSSPVTKVKRAGLIRAVVKLKDELMLLGFISMLVAFTQDTIDGICMPKTWMEPSQDVFVAANHALDPQCKATIYSKGGYGYGGYSSYNATNGTNGTNATNGSAYGRRLLGEPSPVANEAMQFGVEHSAPPDVQAYLESLATAAASSALSSRRQLAASAAGATDCASLGLEGFISGAALHQAHILIFLVAFFHITYAVVTMQLVLYVVAKLDRMEVWGDDEEEDVSDLKAPRPGYCFACIRSCMPGSALRNPFTYISLRNFFIIKHELRVDFPFDDYIHLNATQLFEDVVGMKWWMWALLTITVLSDGLDGRHVGFAWSLMPMLMSTLVGAKVTKIVGDIATKSYKMYDRDGDGKLSEEELLEMQRAHLAMKEENSTTDSEKIRRGVDNAVTDSQFWFGRPDLLSTLMQYIMFQNSMVFTFIVFNMWQVKGECYLPMYLRFVRVGLGLLVLIHDGMVTLPTYVVAVQMGENHNAKTLKIVLDLVKDGQVETSHVEKLAVRTKSARSMRLLSAEGQSGVSALAAKAVLDRASFVVSDSDNYTDGRV